MKPQIGEVDIDKAIISPMVTIFGVIIIGSTFMMMRGPGLWMPEPQPNCICLNCGHEFLDPTDAPVCPVCNSTDIGHLY